MFHSRVFGPLLASCVLATAGHAAELRVAGSDLLGPEFATALEKHGRENDLNVVVAFAGTRIALAQLRAGEADLALVALPPDEPPPGDALVSRAIACQPIVLIAPEALPLTQLTLAQVRGIFAAGGAGSISSWGELGVTGEWRTRTIALHAVDPARALTLPLFRQLALRGADPKPLASAAALDGVLARVAASSNGIGLVPAVPPAGGGLRAIALAVDVRTAAHLPTSENLHDGSYPLRLPLHVVFRRDAAPRLMLLLRFLLSDECADALASVHFQAMPAGARSQFLFELEALAQP